MQTIRIFISSPGDVTEERQTAGKVLERLQGKYWSFVRLDDVFWEQKVVRATAHYQDELAHPGDCEIVVGILWSRLGSLMPEKFRKESGERYQSGTEWELEIAFEAYEKSLAITGDPFIAKPDIIVYRSTQPQPHFEDPAQESLAVEQITKLNGYFREKFWFPDGTIKRPITNYNSLAEFEEMLSRNLEELILRKIPSLKPGFEPPPISGSPFKGLQAFDFADSDRYFGRNREIREIQKRLIDNAGKGLPFILIYGGSGYGKSSLMRAGLSPVMTRPGGSLDGIQGWRRVAFQPARGSGSLCERLARALVQSPAPQEVEHSRHYRHWPLTGLPELVSNSGDPSAWDCAELTRSLSNDDQRSHTVAEIAGTLEALNRHLLLEVDQLEEIFTIPGIAAAERAAFLRVLADLCLSGRVWVVATMRSEFFPRIAEQPELFGLVGKDRGYILPPPDRQSLREIIRYPALAARLDFERRVDDIIIAGENAHADFLHDQILADAESSPDALPLIEFTLQQLYDNRRGNLLTWDAYAAAGGLKGAIAKRATEVFLTLDPAAREARHRVFAALVHIDAARNTITRQRAPLQSLRSGVGEQGFLHAFLGNHLLVTDEDDQTGEAIVALVHEALISHWLELRTWIRDHRGDLLARQRLREQAQLWTQNSGKKSYLLSEARLAEAQRVAATGIFTLTSEESDFLRLSEQRSRKKMRTLKAAVAVFALLALAAALLGVTAKEQAKRAAAGEKEANNQRILADNRRTEAEAERQRAEKGEMTVRKQLALSDMNRAVVAVEPWFDPVMDRIPNVRTYKRSDALAYLAKAVRGDPELHSAGMLLVHLLAQGGYFLPLDQRVAKSTPQIGGLEWREQDASQRWKAKIIEETEATKIAITYLRSDGEEIQENLTISSSWLYHIGPVWSHDMGRIAIGLGSGGEYGHYGEWAVYDLNRGYISGSGVANRQTIVQPLDFSPDGDLLFVYEAGIKLYDVSTYLNGPRLLDEFGDNDSANPAAPVWRDIGTSREFQLDKTVYREIGKPLEIVELSLEEPQVSDRLIDSDHRWTVIGEFMNVSASQPYALLPHPSKNAVLLKFREPGITRIELRNQPWKENLPTWIFRTTIEDAEAMFHPDGHMVLVKDGDAGAGLGPLFFIEAEYGFPLAYNTESGVGLQVTADGSRVVTLHGEAPVVIVPLMQGANTVPGWLADLAEGLGGKVATPEGGLIQLGAADRWNAVRSAFTTARGTKSPWSDYVLKFVSEKSQVKRSAKTPYSPGRKPEPEDAPQPSPRQEPEPDALIESYYRTGEEFFYGRGRDKDRAEASRYYRAAAERGHAPAQHMLGVCYALGEGVELDDELACAWYMKAADQGYADAEYNLGVRYILGKGVGKDPEKGLEFYRSAAAKGHKEAIDALKKRER